MMPNGANRRGSRGQAGTSIVGALASLFAIVAPARAQAQSAAAPDTVRLASGTMLVGRITSREGGKIRVMVASMGEVLIDSAAIAAAPVVRPPMPMVRSPWSGTFSTSGAYVSEVVPGLVGSTLGMQLSAGAARTTPHGGLTLDATLGYWRIRPASAAVNQRSLAFGWHRDLSPRFLTLARSILDVNRVQALKYRSTTLAGIGYAFIKRPKVSLTAAPGLGYTKSEQTAYGRILSFVAAKPPGVDGAAWGAHEMLMAQLTPTLSLQQNILMLRGFTHTPYRQLQADARLTAMVMKHFGLLILFTDQYDSSMPAPVSKSVRTLNPGLQLVL